MARMWEQSQLGSLRETTIPWKNHQNNTHHNKQSDQTKTISAKPTKPVTMAKELDTFKSYCKIINNSVGQLLSLILCRQNSEKETVKKLHEEVTLLRKKDLINGKTNN